MNITPAIVELLKFATNRATNWLLPIILSAVTWLISVTLVNAPFMAESLATVDKEKLAAWLTGAIVAAVLGIINGWTNNKLKEGNVRVQEVINKTLDPDMRPLSLDGVIGPRTVSKAAELANSLLSLLNGKR